MSYQTDDVLVSRIPAYLKAIAYTMTDGGKWHPWHFSTVLSNDMPIGYVRPVGNVEFRINYITVVDKKRPSITSPVSAILFEKGYIWDCINGWRPIKHSEQWLDELKQKFLFEE